MYIHNHFLITKKHYIILYIYTYSLKTSIYLPSLILNIHSTLSSWNTVKETHATLSLGSTDHLANDLKDFLAIHRINWAQGVNLSHGWFQPIPQHVFGKTTTLYIITQVTRLHKYRTVISSRDDKSQPQGVKHPTLHSPDPGDSSNRCRCMSLHMAT